MNKTCCIRTQESKKLFDTTSRVFNRFFNVWTKVTFTREEAKIFENNKLLINEINELISDYQYSLHTIIQNYSKIWFETDENNQRYVKYIELFVYFDNIDLKNRKEFVYKQIAYMRKIIVTIDSFKVFNTGKLRTFINTYKASYTVTTNIYLPIEKTIKLKKNKRLISSIHAIIDMYKANSEDALINNSTILYWTFLTSYYCNTKISLIASYKIEDLKRRLANVNVQRKYARKILEQIKASMSA